MTRASPTADQLPATVREGLERLAADAVGTFGPTPLAKLVAGHLHVFADLRELGASWAQTAGLLTAYGIKGTDGPFAADVLRATYARAAASAAANCATKRNRTKRNKTKGDETQRDDVQRDEVQRGEAKRGALKREGTEPDETKQEKAGGNEAQRRETIPGRADFDETKRKATKAKPADTILANDPDRPAAIADGLAQRAALVNKPLNTR
jgi:hypothetical protein